MAGTIAYVNRAASDDPEVINSDPYGEGWIAKIDLEGDEPALMSAEEYAQLLKSLN